MDPPSPRSRPGSVSVDDSGGVSQVGEWVLGVTLGKGSFGKVKLAVHARTGDRVAVKIVEKSTISNVDDVERVYRETFILTTLKHPHIIKLYEVLDTPLSIMLVMEYAGGGELYTYVQRQRRLVEVECCRIFTQILNGVEYCHRAKIIHRDLKLENILLTEANPASLPSVKIADFGLSNSIKFNEKMGTNCGTPSYTCPEQITGKEYIGSAADIWSLGVIFFAMVCGFLPFEAPSIPALYKRIKAGLYRCPDYISDEAKDLISRMLTVDADKRATIAELRSHPWMLMEYTELIERIESREEVTEQMVDDAHSTCGNWTGEEDREDKRQGKADKDREREREKDRLEQLKGADGAAANRTLDNSRDRTASTSSTASAAASLNAKSAHEESKEDTARLNGGANAAAGGDGGTDVLPVRAVGRAGRGGRTEREGRGNGSLVGGGYAERAGGGGKNGGGHSIFDKLSIRTNGAKPASGANQQGSGRKGAEQLSANLLSPRSGGNSASSSAGSAVSPASGGSARHRKSISLANIAQPNSAANIESARPSAHLAVANTYNEQKASTQPLRFPPISPTATQPHSAAPSLSNDEPASTTSPPIRTARSRHKPPASALLDDHPSAQPSAFATKPATASAATKRSKPLPPPVDAPPVRRPSFDATAAAAGVAGVVGGGGAGGGYMADTNASRHRLLGKLNVDLSS